MNTFLYNLSSKANGRYCDVNGIGRAYNVQLFLRHFSPKNDYGVIQFSDKPFDDCILVTCESPIQPVNNYYVHKMKGLDFRGITLSEDLTTSKDTYIKVTPLSKEIIACIVKYKPTF